jgi:hypothetical protein
VAVDDDDQDLEPQTEGEMRFQKKPPLFSVADCYSCFPVASLVVSSVNVARIKPVLSAEDERAANPELVKPHPGEF